MTPIESTPVSGVAIKKDVVAPLLAPLFFSAAAVGNTEQEHKGMGMPTSDAVATERKFSLPR